MVDPEKQQQRQKDDPLAGDDSNDEDSEEDEEECMDMVPLVPLASPSHKRRQLRSLDISRDDEDETTCWGDSWRFAASLLLMTLLLGPLVHSHLHHYKTTTSTQQNQDDNLLLPSCSSELDFNFTTLMQTWKKEGTSVSYCRSASRCRCKSPLLPRSKGKADSPWGKAHERNNKLAANTNNRKLDVAFLGDSITEHWIGTSVGMLDSRFAPVAQVFEETFVNGTYQGVALGISGDLCPELLWRLQNGELPSTLNPPVLWLLMGANDLGYQCSTDTVLAGVITLVEYLRIARPAATIVVNSLLPALPRGGSNITAQEYPLNQLSASVNAQLACYVASQQDDRIEFFNATGLFVDDNNHVVGMHDFVHPDGDGSRVWANAIVERLDRILSKK